MAADVGLPYLCVMHASTSIEAAAVCVPCSSFLLPTESFPFSNSEAIQSVLVLLTAQLFQTLFDCLNKQIQGGLATMLPPCAHDGLSPGLDFSYLQGRHGPGHASIFTLLEDQVS
jgi:hypothetical protein